MSRIEILKRESMNEEQGRIYDEVEAAGGSADRVVQQRIAMSYLFRLRAGGGDRG